MATHKKPQLLRPAILILWLALIWMVRSQKQTRGYLVLILDNSGSVSEANVEKEKKFAKQLTNTLPVGKDGVHIGVVTLSTGVNIFVDLEQGTDKNHITTQISKIQYNQGTSEFAAALIRAYNMLIGLSYQTREYPRLVVLIGDGNENCKPNDCIKKNCKNAVTCQSQCPWAKSVITNQSFMVTNVAAAKLMVLGAGNKASYEGRLKCWSTEGLYYPLNNYDELISKIQAEITSFFLCKYDKLIDQTGCNRTGPLGRCQRTVTLQPSKASNTCRGNKTNTTTCPDDACGGKPIMINYPDRAKVLYSAKAGSGFPWWWVLLIIVILLVILALIVIVAMMAAKKKRKRDFQVEDAAVGGTVRQDTMRSQFSRIATKRLEERDRSVQPTSGFGQMRSRGQASGITAKRAEEKDMSVQPSSRFRQMRSGTAPAPPQSRIGSQASYQQKLSKAEPSGGAFSKIGASQKSKGGFAR